MNLKRHGLLARCTTKDNVQHYPSSITFKENETSKYGRGSYRFASQNEYGMVGFSWCDGNTVNMISTADGSKIGSVYRQIGQRKLRIQSPCAVQEYNKNMDGVDRWDQLLGKFALHRRHHFKKYYRNIMMIIIDFAILQADRHYHLANPNRSNRVEFYEEMENELIATDWAKVVRTYLSKSNQMMSPDVKFDDKVLEKLGVSMPQTENRNTDMKNNIGLSVNFQACEPVATSIISNSIDGKCCQICKFEGRG